MSEHQTGSRNGMWKGGRVIASNGYVLIRVGISHHLADVRGYAYEHRLVAEQMLGRQLQPGEQVHHKDENKTNNLPENLEVISHAEHGTRHRNEITDGVLFLIKQFPSTRLQLAEYLGASPRQIGWALSRLRRKGLARNTEFGTWEA
jgi:hypothetical protein